MRIGDQTSCTLPARSDAPRVGDGSRFGGGSVANAPALDSLSSQKRCQAGGVGVKERVRTMPRLQPYLTRVSSYLGLLATAWSLFAAGAAPGQNPPIKLDVDATDAARKILHARLQIPAQPGKLTLLYPKWLPGDHASTGPIADLVGLKMKAGGKP